MDWTAIATYAVSAVLSIGAVSAFLGKYMTPVAKWAMVAKDAVETLADLAEALKDGQLTADEITKLKTDVALFQAALKA